MVFVRPMLAVDRLQRPSTEATAAAIRKYHTIGRAFLAIFVVSILMRPVLVMANSFQLRLGILQNLMFLRNHLLIECILSLKWTMIGLKVDFGTGECWEQKTVCILIYIYIFFYSNSRKFNKWQSDSFCDVF